MPAPALADIFDRRADFDPATDLDAFLKQVPARWVVYCFADAGDRPVQLLCVRNLRASLKRRLGGETGDDVDGIVAAPVSKRVDYRQLVRRVYWRRVDSAFEADAVYLEAARQTFPETYRGMVGFRPAWFVHVNPHASFPRYTKTIDPTGETGTYFGPLEDKHAAQRLVHLAEAAFDLCRDYSILTQSPRAGPCAWKQMGKCVGPCDGTVSLDAYRQVVAESAAALRDPAAHAGAQATRMHQAAAELRFEQAERIKQHVEQLAQLGKGAFRHVRPLERFAYLALQRGPRQNTAKVFLITPGRIDEVAGLVSEPAKPGDLPRHVLERAAEHRDDALVDREGVERVGVVAHHLFQAKQTHGVFLPLDELDERQLPKAFRDLQKQKPPEETEGEGVTKELQAM